MPAGRDQRSTASLVEGLRGLLDMGAGTLKGAVQSTAGIPGDVEELVRLLKGQKTETVLDTKGKVKTVLPTTPEVAEWLHSKGLDTGADTATFEKLGESLNPVEPAKAIAPVAKAVGASKAALYANALRKDLLLGHNTHTDKLLVPGKEGYELPRELTNLSLGITKDKPMRFDSGNVLLVPQEGAFDPKTMPTSISAFDSYSPRRTQANGTDIDSARKLMQALREGREFGKSPTATVSQLNALENLRRNADRVVGGRLTDKFVSQFPRGGQLQEGAGLTTLGGLPEYGKGGYGVDITKDKIPYTGHLASYGHRFPDFKTYERSPYGAGRLDDGPDPAKLYRDADDFLVQDLERTTRASGGHVPNETRSIGDDSRNMEILRTLAGVPKNSPHYDPHMTTVAKELMNSLRRTKSDYGEVKAYGQTGLHRGNFAGVIVDPDETDIEVLRALSKSARSRGLAYDEANLQTRNQDVFDLVKAMQRENK